MVKLKTKPHKRTLRREEDVGFGKTAKYTRPNI